MVAQRHSTLQSRIANFASQLWSLAAGAVYNQYCRLPAGETPVQPRRSDRVKALENSTHSATGRVMIVCLALVAGCSTAADEPIEPEPVITSAAKRDATAKSAAAADAAQNPTRRTAEDASPGNVALPEHTFADLVKQAQQNPQQDPRAFGGAQFGHPQHDDARLAKAGIRKIAGERLNVYTDLPQGDVDEFPRVFALAIPQWQAFFELPDDKIENWRMTFYVMKDKALFLREGLLPRELPAFKNGFQRGYEMWAYEQPSDYYRRHLLLHEGTHAVMNTIVGGCGPPWYMEGMAELLGTHQWDGQKLTMNYNPRTKEEVPYWGRVKIIRDEFAAGQGLTLQNVLNYDVSAHQNVSAYAWCWAACRFLDGHPATQRAFREMRGQVRLPTADFNRRLSEQIEDWPRIADEQWFLFVQSLEYGSDPRAAIVHYKAGLPLAASGGSATVKANAGWQSSGIQLEAGKPYQLQATGRFTIARDAQGGDWPCEPGGVTLRYYNGRPLGELQLGVRTGEPKAGERPSLAVAVPLGLRKQFTPQASGTLYFKINDSPAELGDNAGEVQVRIAPAK
jgi:hypothetical protein